MDKEQAQLVGATSGGKPTKTNTAGKERTPEPPLTESEIAEANLDYAQDGVFYAQKRYREGNQKWAIETLEETIEEVPCEPLPYYALAEILYNPSLATNGLPWEHEINANAGVWRPFREQAKIMAALDNCIRFASADWETFAKATLLRTNMLVEKANRRSGRDGGDWFAALRELMKGYKVLYAKLKEREGQAT